MITFQRGFIHLLKWFHTPDWVLLAWGLYVFSFSNAFANIVNLILWLSIHKLPASIIPVL